MDTRKANPKLILILLVLIFLGPFFFAVNMHKKAHQSTLRYNNVGDLILPVKQAQDLIFTSLDNQHTFRGDKLGGKWQFLYIPPLHCDENCQDTLDMMGQIHHALNKSAHQLERMLVLLDHHYLNEFKQYDKKYHLDSQAYYKTLSMVTHKNKRDQVGEFYLIDPKGYIVMYYTGDTPAKGILKDLKKLMRK